MNLNVDQLSSASFFFGANYAGKKSCEKNSTNLNLGQKCECESCHLRMQWEAVSLGETDHHILK